MILGPRSGVSYSGVFGGPSRRRGCHRHGPTTPSEYHAGTTGVRSGSRPAQHYARQNGPQSEPRTSGITLPTTCTQHNGRSDHTLHNELPAQRAVVPHRHAGRWHDGACTTGVKETRFATSPSKKESRSRSTGAERFGIQLPRARWKQASKTERSCAKRSAATTHPTRRTSVRQNRLLFIRS